MRRPPKRVLIEALVLSGYVALAVWRSGLWGDLATHVFAGPDPAQDVWILDWVASRLLSDPACVFEGNNYFPARDAILFSDPLLGPAALVAPLRLLSPDPLLTYNAAVLLVLALASYGFHRLALRLTGSLAAALLAGVAIPYFPQQTHHLVHLNLLTLTGFPWLLLGLFELADRPGPRAALLTGLAFAFQAGTSGYWAFSSALLCLLFVAVDWRRFRSRRALGWSLAAACLATALLMPYLAGVARHRASGDMTRSIETAAAYGVDLGAGLLRSNAYLWRSLWPGGGMSLFPGVTVLVLAATGAWRADRRTRRLLLAVAAVFYVLSLGPELRAFGRGLGPGPFALLFAHVPLLNASRHPVTFAVLSVSALGLLAAAGVAAVDRLRRPAVVVALLAAVTAETWAPRPGRVFRERRLPDVYVYLRSQPPGGILELPLSEGSQWQWWSTLHGLPIVNGMTAFSPAWHDTLHNLIETEWRRRPPGQDMEGWTSLRYLKGHVPLRYLVLHAGTDPATRAHVDATAATFTPMHETAAGDRVYRVGLGGEGRVLRRRFREDQLEGGLRARVRGAAGTQLQLRLNGTDALRMPLDGGWQQPEWRLDQAHVRRGLNLVELATTPPDRPLELGWLEPALVRTRCE